MNRTVIDRLWAAARTIPVHPIDTAGMLHTGAPVRRWLRRAPIGILIGIAVGVVAVVKDGDVQPSSGTPSPTVIARPTTTALVSAGRPPEGYPHVLPPGTARRVITAMVDADDALLDALGIRIGTDMVHIVAGRDHLTLDRTGGGRDWLTLATEGDHRGPALPVIITDEDGLMRFWQYVPDEVDAALQRQIVAVQRERRSGRKDSLHHTMFVRARQWTLSRTDLVPVRIRLRPAVTAAADRPAWRPTLVLWYPRSAGIVNAVHGPSRPTLKADVTSLPARSRRTMTVAVTSDRPMDVVLELLAIDGRVITTLESRRMATGTTPVGIDVPDLPAGVYVVSGTSGGDVLVQQPIVIAGE